MADGLFLMGTDRGVGKTLVGVGLTALLRAMGVDAVMMTPVATGGASESARALLSSVGVEAPRQLISPLNFETLAAPYVASRVEGRPVEVPRVLDAYRALRARGQFVVVEGGGVLVPLARHYAMVDLLKDMKLPSIIIGRTGRGTLNHCLLTLRMMLAMGHHPLGFILNGFGQFGEGFAEALNPEVLRELAAPVPVLATLEWRPEYQEDVQAFIRALKQSPPLVTMLKQLTKADGTRDLDGHGPFQN
jgi:dethiobiotin synthetase